MSTSKPPVVVAVVEDHAPSRTAGASPPMIVTTSSHETEIEERARQNGCAGFFRKPVFGSTLMSAIAALANR